MALKLRITRPCFLLDVAEATEGKVQDLIEIYGFLGDWKKPKGIVVAIGPDLWLIDSNEIKEELQDAGPEDPEDFEKALLAVNFEYKGNDYEFLRAAIAAKGIEVGGVSADSAPVKAAELKEESPTSS